MDKARLWLSRYGLTWIPPIVGAGYLVFWILAEAGRYALVEKTVVFALLALAIALSGWKPLVSLILIVL
ncbi:hypothetical protein, partial [Enterobacter hormaechei]|uniref:hypothetical protein n=1 Tax=Enterobacter hormaechei TaxID=158836 RepID=UPI00312C935F